MKNYVQAGDTLTLPAPSGGVVGGSLYKIGALVGVAADTAAQGVPFGFKLTGVYELATAAGISPTAGNAAYRNTSTGALQTTGDTADKIGTFLTTGTSITKMLVRLNGVTV